MVILIQVMEEKAKNTDGWGSVKEVDARRMDGFKIAL